MPNPTAQTTTNSNYTPTLICFKLDWGTASRSIVISERSSMPMHHDLHWILSITAVAGPFCKTESRDCCKSELLDLYEAMGNMEFPKDSPLTRSIWWRYSSTPIWPKWIRNIVTFCDVEIPTRYHPLRIGHGYWWKRFSVSGRRSMRNGNITAEWTKCMSSRVWRYGAMFRWALQPLYQPLCLCRLCALRVLYLFECYALFISPEERRPKIRRSSWHDIDTAAAWQWERGDCLWLHTIFGVLRRTRDSVFRRNDNIKNS